MSKNLLRISRFTLPSRALQPIIRNHAFTTTRPASIAVDSDFLSQITAAEKLITKKDGPVQNGPTACAQAHVGSELTSKVIHDITVGERRITGQEGPVQGGPTSVAQRFMTNNSTFANSLHTPNSTSTATSTTNTNTGGRAKTSGNLDSDTISKITEKEKNITGQDHAVKGGPTTKAQQHANEPITSEALHDITEGEKKVTGGERVKGGPTSAAQSALGQSRS
jgi:hypothetical protein